LATVAPATLDERVAARAADLSPAEERVARFFAEHREEVAFISAAEIAQRLETSDATVVRAAQALGYDGLPQLKQELRDALRTRATPALRLGRSLEELGDDAAAILEHGLAAHIQLVTEARRTIKPEDFRRAIDVLAEADRIVVFGLGPNGKLAEYFALRLQRTGRETIAFTGRGAALADDLIGFRRGDAMAAFVFDRANAEARTALAQARKRRVPVVLLTDTLALALQGQYKVALSARHGGTGAMQQSAVWMAVAETILFALAARDRPRALETLEEMNALRSQVMGD
jgi:DNA-binding MurR/RpiR family transcriptional regulator